MRLLPMLLALCTAGCNAEQIAERSAGSPAAEPPPLVTVRFYADAHVSGEASAPSAVRLPPISRAGTAPAVINLPLIVALHNHGKRMVEVTAPTPCAVFRWSVVDAQLHEVEAEPNGLCAQAVASDRLPPGQQVESVYQVPLHTQHYAAGKRYRLLFSFWGYHGQHDFRIERRD